MLPPGDDFLRARGNLQGDVAVLHDLERDFVLNLVNAEAGCRLVLEMKPLTWLSATSGPK